MTVYTVRDSEGETVLICTRKEDAEAFASTNLDDTVYTIEESNDD
jgi:hypothetical protein